MGGRVAWQRIPAVAVMGFVVLSCAGVPAVAATQPTEGSSVSAGGFVNVVATSPNGLVAVAGTDAGGGLPFGVRGARPGGGDVVYE